MSTPAAVSFTVRRPTPISRTDSDASESDGGASYGTKKSKPAIPRHLTNDSSAPGSPLARGSGTSSPFAFDNSSDEEDDELQDELLVGFDKFGVRRLHEKKEKPSGPLVIPALSNKNWRELAKKRRAANQFVPDSARAPTGADGSVGGLGTRDTINSGPQLEGLQFKKAKVKLEEDEDTDMEDAQASADSTPAPKKEEETEDQKALKAILASASGDVPDGPIVDLIPVSEQEAYLQDVEELPDVATLDDYARVPVAQFGAALLRGMGWTEGTAASRRIGKDGKARGVVEPYLPEARPALLGIGAKERVIDDDGSKKKGGRRPDKKYMPLIKREIAKESSRDGSSRDRREDSSDRHKSSTRDRSGERSHRDRKDRERGSRAQSPESRTKSRRNSRSRSPKRDRERDRDRGYDRGRDDKGRDKDRRDRDYDRDDRRRRDYDYDSGREKRTEKRDR